MHPTSEDQGILSAVNKAASGGAHRSLKDRASGFGRASKTLVLLLVGIPSLLVIILAWKIVHVTAEPVPQREPVPTASVVCLGHIEPEDGLITVGARSLSGQPSLVAELRVKEGDFVQAGQELAVLNSKDELAATLQVAQARVVLAQKRLDQVKAGAKTEDLAVQQAEIAQAQAEVANAEIENRRTELLYENKITTASSVDLSRLQLETRRQQLKQAENRLQSLAEVRETDVSVAQADIQVALADAAHARAEYEQAVVRSPDRGRVIKINSRPGQEVGSKGILELGKTERMYAIAEVPEDDIIHMAVGDRAAITGKDLPEKIDGVVEQIGMKVGRSEDINTDPAAFTQARVVSVKIRLHDPKRVEGLIDSEVQVFIKH
jgi:HlyD family secretion protein